MGFRVVISGVMLYYSIAHMMKTHMKFKVSKHGETGMIRTRRARRMLRRVLGSLCTSLSL